MLELVVMFMYGHRRIQALHKLHKCIHYPLTYNFVLQETMFEHKKKYLISHGF